MPRELGNTAIYEYNIAINGWHITVNVVIMNTPGNLLEIEASRKNYVFDIDESQVNMLAHVHLQAVANLKTKESCLCIMYVDRCDCPTTLDCPSI